MRHTEAARPWPQDRHEAQGREPVDPQAEHDKVSECVDARDEFVRRGPAEIEEVGDLRPRRWQPPDLEVGPVGVVQDEQPVSDGFDVVDHLVAAGQHAAGLLQRTCRVDEPHLGGRLGG